MGMREGQDSGVVCRLDVSPSKARLTVSLIKHPRLEQTFTEDEYLIIRRGENRERLLNWVQDVIKISSNHPRMAIKN